MSHPHVAPAADQPTFDQQSSIARPPSTAEIGFDRAFRFATTAFAWLTILLVAAILLEVGRKAAPALSKYGLGLLTSVKWDTNREDYGILPQIWGTVYSSVLGVSIGALFGVTIAIFLSQDFLAPRFELLFKNIVELLAAIPSVVYGLWGIFVVIPMLRPPAQWLHEHLGQIPFFSTNMAGPGMLPAALVLAIMVLPTISAISRDALVSVPPKIKEAALGLGATRWETILGVIVPTASTGILGDAVILGFGRALGETMALAMLVGNRNDLSLSLFSPGDTLAALLANKFPEAGPDEVQVLMYAAMVLLAITLFVNCIGTLVVNRAASKLSGIKK